MKLTFAGILICLVCLQLMILGENSWLYALGGYTFYVGVIIAVIGLIRKWKK